MLRIGIIAGEVSGDLLGAGLITALVKRFPDIQFEGIAGKAMQAAGCTAWYEADELAVMGLTEVLSDLPRLLKIKKAVLERWAKNPPDLFIGIDAPDFNLRVAKVLKSNGVKSVHYVSPSVWAWRQGRVKKIAAAVDHLLCLLPFEPQYYSETSVKAHFVGHPLADSISTHASGMIKNDLDVRTSNDSSNGDYIDLTQTVRIFTGETTKVNIFSMGLESGENVKKRVGLLPGSRMGEVKRLLIPFLKTALLLQEKYTDIECYLPIPNQKISDYVRETVVNHAPNLKLNISYSNAGDVLENVDVALLASGTVSLEAMLYQCPMVVAYKLAPSTFHFLRISKMYKAKYFSLPNILADEMLVPELLQNEVQPEALVSKISYWLDNPDKTEQLKHRFEELHTVLKQDTNEKVADVIQNILS